MVEAAFLLWTNADGHRNNDLQRDRFPASDSRWSESPLVLRRPAAALERFAGAIVAMARNQTPIVLVFGGGSVGKTTVIHHLLSQFPESRVSLVRDEGNWSRKDVLVELSAGESPGLVVMECAAALEPFAVVEDLGARNDRAKDDRHFRDEKKDDVKGEVRFRIRAVVTVVDASRFFADARSKEPLRQARRWRPESVEPSGVSDDDRTVSEVLLDQVEYADAIVINKSNLISGARLEQLSALLHRLNPRAIRLVSEDGYVPFHELAGAELFDSEHADEGAGWLAELRGDFDDMLAIRRVSSFTWLERRPFHPLRLNELLVDFQAKGLFRAKGLIWIATRHHEVGILSIAGRSQAVLNRGGFWYAATPARDWPEDPGIRAEIMEQWALPYGDRRQELAFIGIDMDQKFIRECFEDCLLTYAEMKEGPDLWRLIPDPLPDWDEDPMPQPSPYGSQFFTYR